MERKIEIPLSEILDVIVAAPDYGYDKSVLMSSLAEWTGFVSDEEIEDFVGGFPPQYEEEDKVNMTEILKDWRNVYGPKGRSSTP